MASVPHVTSGSGLRKFQGDGFLLDRVYSHSGSNLHIKLRYAYQMKKGIRQAMHHPSHTTKFGGHYTKNLKEGKNTKH